MTEALALVVLPLVASAIHALSFWKYNLQAKKGTLKPKFVSWAIWSFMAILNSLSFMAITSLIVALQTFVGAAGCCGTFIHALITGKFKWPKWDEWAILVIGLVVVVVWRFYNPLYANLVLISALVLSFWSTWEAVWADPTEKSLPWILWGSAYGVTTFVTFLLGGFSLKLTMPIILTLAHLSVPAICTVRKRKEKR